MRFSTTFSFMELSRSEAVAKGKELAGLGRSWHIHALHPGCRFNPKPDQYCFVVEDSDSSLMWCVFSENPFTAECQELVTLLHGDEILDASRSEDTLVPVDQIEDVTIYDPMVISENREDWMERFQDAVLGN